MQPLEPVQRPRLLAERRSVPLLEFARIMISEGTVALLDEPLAGSTR